MGDPLSLLRQFNVNRKEIITKGDNVIFGEYSWPKTVKTNYLIYGSDKDGAGKDYYTLECLLFMLKNVQLSHPVYVRQAASENISVVRRPDRKELLAYLNGDSNTAAAVDKTAPIEMPTQVKRVAEGGEGGAGKKQRLEQGASQRMQKQLALRFGAPDRMASLMTDIDRSLSETMSIERIAAIKAKRLAKKRGTIKGDDDLEAEGGLLDVTRDITSKERVWRERTSVLQSTVKEFGPSILGLLKNIRLREEGSQRAGLPTPLSAPQPQQGYSRYAQEKFNPKEETAGFKINTMSSYHGLDLKSVTEGGQRPAPGPKPAQSPGRLPPAPVSPGASPQSPAALRKVSRKPIIIVPNSNKSLITMLNAKDLLQDMKYIPVEAKRTQGGKRETEILIQRGKEGGLTVPYRVTDNPGKLTQQEWDRVVAVFAMGPCWQFKGWPYHGNPVEIFNRICAFHIKYDEAKLDPNIAKWSVHVISLSRVRRHLDRAAFQQCWERLDRFMLFNKPHLRG